MNLEGLEQDEGAPLSSTPLFIVGCPRSGTKLLRTLLNNHPDISLAHEGHYIPPLVKGFGREADFSQRATWKQVYVAFTRSAFYHTWRDRGTSLAEADFLSSYDALLARGEKPAWSHVIEALMRPYGPRPNARIWGDKSHAYLFVVPLLRELLPGVRFLYIVRDPRDQALSAQRAWGKHPLRSAQKWLASARKAEQLDLLAAKDTLLLRYEDLTSDPLKELERVCLFLGVPWQEELSSLGQFTEDLGDTRGRTEIVSQRGKYREMLSPQVTRRISEITLPYLSQYGYPEEGAVAHHPLTRMQRRGLRYLDGFSSLRFHMREKGPVKGLRYYWLRHQMVLKQV